MSRQQIGQFSAFLMHWISDKANNQAVLDAIHRATDGYAEERRLLQTRLGNPEGSSSDGEEAPVAQAGDGDHFQVLLHRAKALVERARVATKTAAASAYSNAIDYASSNTVALFHDVCPSPDPKKFLLELDVRAGTWDVGGGHLVSQRTSLKTRIIAEVSRAYYVSHFVSRDPLAGTVNPETDCVEVPEFVDERAQPRGSQSKFDQYEARNLKLLAENIIDPLSKPGHAQTIHQCLIAIEMAERVKKLCEPVAEVGAKKAVVLPAPPERVSAAPASASAGEESHVRDDNRSTVNFHSS